MARSRTRGVGSRRTAAITVVSRAAGVALARVSPTWRLSGVLRHDEVVSPRVDEDGAVRERVADRRRHDERRSAAGVGEPSGGAAGHRAAEDGGRQLLRVFGGEGPQGDFDVREGIRFREAGDRRREGRRSGTSGADDEQGLCVESAEHEAECTRGRRVHPLDVVHHDAEGLVEGVDGVEDRPADAQGIDRVVVPGRREVRTDASSDGLGGRVREIRFERGRSDPDHTTVVESAHGLVEEGGLAVAGWPRQQDGGGVRPCAFGALGDGRQFGRSGDKRGRRPSVHAVLPSSGRSPRRLIRRRDDRFSHVPSGRVCTLGGAPPPTGGARVVSARVVSTGGTSSRG